MSFKNYVEKRSGTDLAAASNEELQEELNTRDRIKNIFPLDVFHEDTKPFINALVNKFDIPRSYVGLAMLATYSTAIGTAYAVSPSGHNLIYLPIWGCLCGISSSGKSLAVDMTHKPIFDIQKKFDQDFDELPDDSKSHAPMKTIIYRDTHVPTLMRYIMPDNPKGVSKYADEIMEWINGMNSLSKKEGTDEQFWISSWNCKNYSAIRANKVKYTIPRPFVNVTGGIQPTIMHKLFAKDRDTTGFIFRLLFALPDEMKIAEPDGNYEMPPEYMQIHSNIVNKLYTELDVEDPYEEPKKCSLSRGAIKMYDLWTKKKIKAINQMKEVTDKEIHSGILGKIKEYAYRFAGILMIVDKAFDMDHTDAFRGFPSHLHITESVMERALKLAEYFYNSAAEAYEIVQTKVTAPPDVLIAATLFRQRASYSDIARTLYGDERHKQKAFRMVKQWIKEYPRVFNAEARTR